MQENSKSGSSVTYMIKVVWDYTSFKTNVLKTKIYLNYIYWFFGGVGTGSVIVFTVTIIRHIPFTQSNTSTNKKLQIFS